MRLRDPKNGYSWLSIALHWITAIIILTLWFIGSSIDADRVNGSLATLNLHTSIAISAYALLWARIIWRFWYKHPGPMPAQAGLFYEIGKYTHYLIIGSVGAILHIGGVYKHAAFNQDGTFSKMLIASRDEN